MDLISRQTAIDALRYAQHRFTVADEAGGMGTVKWSEDVIYFAAAERVLSELPSAQPEQIARDISTIIENERDMRVILNAPSAQSEIIRCKDCMHNGSFDTDCPIDWNGKEYCSFAERKEDE